ncbi:MAG: hypothetical protein ACRDUY_08735, partial [Nitriliruptorales bacterium]
ELTRGGLLVEVDGRERRIVLGPVLAVGRGIWRVDADSAPRVAVYEGGAAVRPADAGDGGLPVGRLHQADLAGDVLPGEALPLRYDVADAWDARLLVDALEIDRQTDQLHRSLSAQHGEERRPVSFYRSFAVVDDPVADALAEFAVDTRGNEVGPPADVLVHVVAVDLLRTVRRLDPDEAIDRVTSLRRAGATWGVVLTLHDLDADDLRTGLDLSLREGSTLAAPVTTTPRDDVEPPPAPPEEPGGEEPTPAPPPADEPIIPCEGEECDEANELADDLVDLIDDIVPDDDPDDDEARDLADDLLEQTREQREAERDARKEQREAEREEREDAPLP